MKQLSIAAALLISVGGTSSAAVPAILPVQGFLTDAAGTALTGSVDITFALYDSADATTPAYAETLSAVALNHGYFAVDLGTVTPLDLAIFQTGAEYLGITVGTDSEMQPRLRLGVTPFAAMASYATDAASIDGLNVTDLRLAADPVDWTDIANVPSSVTADTLADLSCDTDDIVRWDGTSWICSTIAAASETDPYFSASTASGITATNVTNWSTAYGWGNHASAGYLTAESDPDFAASTASGITATNVTNWNATYAKIGSQTADIVPRWNGTALVAGSIFDDGSAIAIGTDAPEGQFHVAAVGDLVADVTATSTTNGICGMTGYVCYQSFTPTKSGLLGKIFTMVTTDGASCVVRLYEGACSPSCSNPIAVSDYGTNIPAGSVDLGDYVFSTPPQITAGNVYTFEPYGCTSYSNRGSSFYAGGAGYSSLNPGLTMDLPFISYMVSSNHLVLDEGFMYFGQPSVDGSWRMGVVNGSFEIQVRSSGTWTTKATYAP